MTGLAALRCVVLGAGGFIGTNLCRHLSGRVRSLKAFGRRQSFPEALAGIDWLPGDFNDPTAVASAIEGSDTVFHLVNTTTPSSANVDKLADLRTNVASTLHLLEACREAKVRQVVFISSGGTVYGIPDQVPTPESAASWPITAYGISKLATERYLHLYRHLHGLDYRILRVSNPYGPYQTAVKNQGVIAAFLRNAMAGRPLEVWGDGSVSRDYVFIADVIDAIERAALHDGADRIFNIGSGQSRSLNAVIDSLGTVLGAMPRVTYFPARPMDVPVSALDVGLAARALGWRPTTDFSDGLRTTVAWLREAQVVHKLAVPNIAAV